MCTISQNDQLTASQKLAKTKFYKELGLDENGIVVKPKNEWGIDPKASNKRYIFQISPFVFAISYHLMPLFRLVVDFSPIISKFKLEGNYILAHWHGGPVTNKNLRHFAYFQYKAGVGSYHVIPSDQMDQSTLCFTKMLQIEDGMAKVLPSAVIYYPDCELIVTKEGKFKICDHALCVLENDIRGKKTKKKEEVL